MSKQREDEQEAKGPDSGLRDPHAGPRLGRIARIGPEGEVFVRIGEGPARRAWVASMLSLEDLAAAMREDKPTLVQFIDGDPEQPVVAGFVVERVEPEKIPRQLDLSAYESFTVRVGRAVFELHRDGRIVVRGAEIAVEADGPVEVRGSHVKLN
jgi:hypothetical protein